MTIHVQLLPTFPPTSNSLEPKQRLRLGGEATPLFLDLNSKGPMVSPRTRAMRRKGQVFHSSSSSVSSSESEYVFIRQSPSSSRSSSPDVVKDTRSEKSAKIQNRNGKTKGPQILAQPSLLRLRSVPHVPLNIKSGVRTVEQPKPLPFNMDTVSPPPTPHVLTDSEKRKKLAKLARTLGENVPPELVFHSLPLERATSRPRTSPLSHKPSQSTPTRTAESPAPTDRKKVKKSSRPRSMTLITSMVTRSTSDGTSSTDTTDPPTITVDTTQRNDGLSFELEWGRRKEKEWSGEWNVKDMNFVVRALRDLKL